MLTIRPAQMQALAQVNEEGVLSQMREHARAYFPKAVEGVDEPSLRAFLERTLKDSQGFGLNKLPDVLLYMNLSLAFGEDYLSRRDLAWLKEFLFDPEISSAPERLRNAYQEVVRRYE